MQAALTFAQLKPYLSAAVSMPEVKVDQSKMHGINMIIAHIQKGLANDTAYQYLRQLCGSEVWDSVRHQVLMQQGMAMQQGSGSGAGGGESGANGKAPANTLPSQTQTLAQQQPLAAQTQAQDQQAQGQQKRRNLGLVDWNRSISTTGLNEVIGACTFTFLLFRCCCLSVLSHAHAIQLSTDPSGFF